MYNCIFSSHCTELFCDRSCPILAETSYLLDRNGITMNSSVFSESTKNINRMLDILKKSDNTLGACIISGTMDTVRAADLLTYCAICQNWKGNQLHCNVYNLKLSKYLELTKQSWNSKSDSEDLEYMRIWSESAKVLIVSNIDYINFGDFESQTLLNLIQTRSTGDKTTIVVSPPISSLVSSKSSMFFTNLRHRLSEAVRRMDE